MNDDAIAGYVCLGSLTDWKEESKQAGWEFRRESKKGDRMHTITSERETWLILVREFESNQKYKVAGHSVIEGTC